MHKSQRKFTPENVQIMLTKLRIMGKPMPLIHAFCDETWHHGPFDKVPEPIQKRYWVKLMQYASGKLERW